MTTFLLILFCLIAAIYMQVHFGKIIYRRGVKAGKSMAHAEHIADIGRARADATMAAVRAEKSREMQNGALPAGSLGSPMNPISVADAVMRAEVGSTHRAKYDQ